MGVIHYENWDGASAPALPSGWNSTGDWATTTAGPPLTAPNAVTLPGGSGPQALTWATLDGNGGDVSVAGTTNDPSPFASLSYASVFARCSASSLVFGTSNYYEARIDYQNSQVLLISHVGATATTIGTVSSVTWTSGGWYYPTLICNGTTISVQVQFGSGGDWLNSSGAFVVSGSPINAISVTDATVTGAGYAGYIGDGAFVNSQYCDDWTLANFSAVDVLTAGGGSFVVAGEAATFARTIHLPTSAGAYAITGDSVLLGGSRTFDAAPRAFAITGEAASFGRTYNLSSSTGFGIVGAFSVHGDAITLTGSRTFDPTPGAYLVSSFDKDLSTQRNTTAATGSFTIAGTADSYAVTLSIIATPGAFIVGGEAVALIPATTFTAPGTYLITGAPGSGPNTELLLAAVPGAYRIAGSSQQLPLHTSVVATPGMFLIAGEAVGLGGSTVAYHVYANTGAGDPINYDSPIDTTTTTTFTTNPLSYPGTWWFGVRAFNAYGEEQNLDCAIEIILDAAGIDVTNQPLPPSGLRALAMAGGAIRVEWFYPPTSGPKTPIGFDVYIGAGAVPDYSMPAATVAYTPGFGSAFVANLSGYVGGDTYTIGVRAYNAVAIEHNTNTVAVVPITVGPSAVVYLTGVATS